MPGRGTGSPGGWLRVLLLVLTLAGPGLPEVVQGQAPVLREPAPDEILVVGRVEDGLTGTPLIAAIVRVPDRGLVTLSEEGGIFTLGPLPPGEYHVQVDRFGYVPADFDVAVVAGVPPILVLDPGPVLVDGVVVTVDRLQSAEERLESRMRSIPFRIVTLDARQLADSRSQDPLVELARAGVPLSVCPSDLSPYGCIMQRGGFGPVSIYLDEMPLVGGADHFSMLPTSMLHRVEVIPRLGQVRAYTRRYVEWMAAGNRHPAPILWW